jgi:hypothetical protein
MSKLEHSSATSRGYQPSVSRPYRTIVLSLMIATSSIAMFDLYLFASSGMH